VTGQAACDRGKRSLGARSVWPAALGEIGAPAAALDAQLRDPTRTKSTALTASFRSSDSEDDRAQHGIGGPAQISACCHGRYAKPYMSAHSLYG
jgi:hypothetical protein